MGDNKKEDLDKVEKALLKLEGFLTEQDGTLFDKEDGKALLEVAKFWRAARGTLWLLGGAGGGLKWVLTFAAILAAIKYGVLDWLQTALSNFS